MAAVAKPPRELLLARPNRFELLSQIRSVQDQNKTPSSHLSSALPLCYLADLAAFDEIRPQSARDEVRKGARHIREFEICCAADLPPSPQAFTYAAFGLFTFSMRSRNLAEITPRNLDVVVVLQIKPKLGRRAECLAEPKRSISGDASLFADDPLDPRTRQAASLCKSARRHMQRNRETLREEPRRDAWALAFWSCRFFLLMVVHDLDLGWAFSRPNKAQPKLVIDPDRVLPLAIARQRLKTISRRRPQVAEFACGVEVAQFSPRHLDQIGRKAPGAFPIEDGFGGLIAEAPNHSRYVSLKDTGFKIGVSRNDTAPLISVTAPHSVGMRRRVRRWPAHVDRHLALIEAAG